MHKGYYKANGRIKPATERRALRDGLVGLDRGFSKPVKAPPALSSFNARLPEMPSAEKCRMAEARPLYAAPMASVEPDWATLGEEAREDSIRDTDGLGRPRNCLQLRGARTDRLPDDNEALDEALAEMKKEKKHAIA